MIKLIQGDLFDYAAAGSLILHGCNLKGYMGKGFANIIRSMYPELYLEYNWMCRRKLTKLGDWYLYHDHARGYNIMSLMTQEDIGEDPSVVYVDYKALSKGLISAKKYAERTGYTVHSPLIGGGLANGNAETIKQIYEEVFDRIDCMLYLLPKVKNGSKQHNSRRNHTSTDTQ